eukprot:224377_1
MATVTPFTKVSEGRVDIVVNDPVSDEGSRSKPDDSCLYWLSCICCNCFGLGFIAFIFHYVAKSLFESGAHQRRAANSLWKRARWFRKLGVTVTLIVILIYMAYIGLVFFELCPHRMHAYSDDVDMGHTENGQLIDSDIGPQEDGY